MNTLDSVYNHNRDNLLADTEALLSQASVETELDSAIAAADRLRWARVDDMRMLANAQISAPELPGEAPEVYERIVDAERRKVAPNLLSTDYGDGTAKEDDEVQAVTGDGSRVLLSAEHATDPVRLKSGEREGADYGTGGLAAVLAEDGLVDAYLNVGKQTVAPANVPTTKLKQEISKALLEQPEGFVSLHGKVPGHVTGLLETDEVHALLGLGRHKPSDTTLEAVERIRSAARRELGLRVEVGNTTPYLIFEKDAAWQSGGPIRDRTAALARDENGAIRTGRLGAIGDSTMTNFVAEWLKQHEQRDIPVMQVENSRSILWTPEDMYARDKQKLIAGVYMGYLLNKLIIEITRETAAAQ